MNIIKVSHIKRTRFCWQCVSVVICFLAVFYLFFTYNYKVPKLKDIILPHGRAIMMSYSDVTTAVPDVYLTQYLPQTSMHAHKAQLHRRKDEVAANLKPSAIMKNNIDPEPRLILYNKVPKCGSTTLINIIHNVSDRNGVIFRNHGVFRGRRVQKGREMLFVKRAAHMEPHTFLNRHILLPNFTQFQEDFPTMINLIRDPVDRVISEYYYKQTYAHAFHIMNSSPLKQPLGRCLSVPTGGKNCISTYTILSFFCGQSSMCQEASSAVVNRAKQNVIRYYSTVGILEDLDTFIRLLERMFPTYFTGLHAAHNTKAGKLHRRTTTKSRVEPSPRTKKRLKQLLAHEYDFYKFIKQRFYDQVQNILGLNLTERHLADKIPDILTDDYSGGL